MSTILKLDMWDLAQMSTSNRKQNYTSKQVINKYHCPPLVERKPKVFVLEWSKETSAAVLTSKYSLIELFVE